MIKFEAGGALDVVVSAIAQAVVFADKYLLRICISRANCYAVYSFTYRLAASRQLHSNQLLLVVLLKRWTELRKEVRRRGRKGLDICISKHSSVWGTRVAIVA